MTVEISPIGLQCNLHCKYCSENFAREAGNLGKPFNLELALKSFSSTGASSFGIHGGEPLIVPFEILENLIKTKKCSGIQTNGLALTDKHIKLFKEFNMSIGISIDGDRELNSARCDLKQTAQIIKNIWRLREAKIDVTIASVISKANYKDPQQYVNFLTSMQAIGIVWYKTHLIQPETDLFITGAPLLEFLLYLLNWEQKTDSTIHNEFFKNMYTNLQGRINETYCCWKGCDPYCTSAVDGIYGDGELYNCERMTKDGQSWIKAKQMNQTIRSRRLWETECKDCKFFAVCQGFCPGTALDWRKKTEHCWTLYQLYERMEKELKQLWVPLITTSPQLLMQQSCSNRAHGDVPHGDHTDSVPHGDHTDMEKK